MKVAALVGLLASLAKGSWVPEKAVRHRGGSLLDGQVDACSAEKMTRVACHVREVAVHACLDTGAQCSVMSEGCAMRCGLLPLMDRSFAGRAVGVGSARILGRVRDATMVLGGSEEDVSPSGLMADMDAGVEIQTDLIIIEGDQLGADTDVLLGHDFLKKHGCVINYRDGTLRMPASPISNQENVIPFLGARSAAPQTRDVDDYDDDDGDHHGAHEPHHFDGDAMQEDERMSALERSERKRAAPRRKDWGLSSTLPTAEPTAVARGGAASADDEDGEIDWWGAKAAEQHREHSGREDGEDSFSLEGI